MLDLKALSYVLAIAKCGNFSRAAGELGLSQSALTKRVQAMEADFGFRLFDRDRTGVSVTAQAKELIEQAGLLLADATALEQQFRQSGKGKAGNLCFGIAPLPAQAFLHDAMALSLEQTPEVELEATVRSVDAL